MLTAFSRALWLQQAALGPRRATTERNGAAGAFYIDGCLKEETFNCK